MNDPNAPGGQMPPASQTPPPPPPGPQGWQSTPQQPGPPPMGGGQPGGGMPAWSSNLTARGTIPGPGGLALADATSRFIAAFIDFLILGVIGYIVNIISTSVLGDSFVFFGFNSTVKVPSLLSSLLTVVVMLAISAAYFIYQWSRMNGVTVGGRVMKLSVRDAVAGDMVTQQQAITRWMYLGAPWALSFFYGWGIGIIIGILVLVYYIYLVYTISQSPTRQGLHDKQAKTIVAKVAP
jgi:uncharacterized RDD family membrane protein YckC